VGGSPCTTKMFLITTLKFLERVGRTQISLSQPCARVCSAASVSFLGKNGIGHRAISRGTASPEPRPSSSCEEVFPIYLVLLPHHPTSPFSICLPPILPSTPPLFVQPPPSTPSPLPPPQPPNPAPNPGPSNTPLQSSEVSTPAL
jgi:hypothetical protein